ncbi:MAG: ribosome-associated translation inhibitor RaiA [Peptoniphilaceae bacterium]|nr:ribosome-associated translation inhibitor RaiA [Peptoniphilaceae bacterium]MDY6018176.1 ribosome-associated translation inhibitor RaiA [Anaerococcus sp.]
MKLNIRGKNINVTEDLKEMCQAKFDRLDKYFHEEEMDVNLAVEGIEKKVESTIYLKGGTILRAEEKSEDFMDSVDMIVDSLVRQIRKYKTKLQRDRKSGESIRFESLSDDLEEEKESTSKIVRFKEISVKPMNEEEAVLQMELLNHDFFVFLDDQEMQVRVVYKRKDGNYGEIIPTMK